MDREHFVISAVVRLRLSPSLEDLGQALRHAWKTLRYCLPSHCRLCSGEYLRLRSPYPFYHRFLALREFTTEQITSSTFSLCEASAPIEPAKMHHLPYTSESFSARFIDASMASDFYVYSTTSSKHSPSTTHPIRRRGSKSLHRPGRSRQGSLGGDAYNGAVCHKSCPATRNNVPSMGLPTSTDPNSWWQCTLRDNFHSALTSSILARCKAFGVSATAATHTAVVNTNSRNADPGNTYRTSIPKSQWSSTFPVPKRMFHSSKSYTAGA